MIGKGVFLLGKGSSNMATLWNRGQESRISSLYSCEQRFVSEIWRGNHVFRKPTKFVLLEYPLGYAAL